MVRRIKIPLIICLVLYGFALNIAIAQRDTIYFRVGMEKRVDNTVDILMRTANDNEQAFIDFRMPVWSPGYYQLMDFPAQIAGFTATDARGNALQWEKVGQDSWRIHAGASNEIVASYTVLASRPFVGTSYIDTNRAFIKPAGLFMCLDGELKKPVRLTLNTPVEWSDVATGLDALAADSFTFVAPDFDILYDRPLLVGKLRHLPPFYINNIEHRFIRYGMEDFDDISLMADIQKIVESSAALMGDLPYRHYIFIGLGPGQGGIEQLNSTAISFTGKGLDGPGRLNILSFIAHEYFHHCNVKRIRPIELGPFDKPGETISYYVKGPIIGMLLDIEIRHATKNEESLDDVMRKLYHTYYKAAGRGFNEEEMKRACEEIAGKSLDDIFKYIYTLDEIDYPAYFEKAGLDIRFTVEQDEKGTVLRKPVIALKAYPNALQQQIRKDLFGL